MPDLGEVYLVLYPFDDADREKLRPGIILDTRGDASIVIKVTSHDQRAGSKDVVLEYWQEAGLRQPSVARCSQYVPLDRNKIKGRLGKLHDADLARVLSQIV